MALFLYVAELFFLAVFFLIAAGSVVTTLFVLFRRPYDFWIFASPSYRHPASFAFARVFFSSSWPLVVVAVPALFAMKDVFGLAAAGFLIVFCAVVLLSLIATLLGAVLVVGLARLLASFPFRRFIRISVSTLAAFSIASIILSVAVLWRRIASADILLLFHAEDLDRAAAGVERIRHVFYFVPSHFTAETAHALLAGDTLGAVYMLLILGVLFVSLGVLYLFLSHDLLLVWARMQEGGFRAGPRASPVRILGGPFPHFFRGVLGAVYEKELLLFVRSGKNMLWAGFIFFLWLLQTGLNVILARAVARAEFDPALMAPVAVSIQFATMIFFISAFVLRFAFPSFSTERKTIWILGSAPVDFGSVFYGKFLFFGSLFLLFGLSTGFLNASILGIPLLASFLILSFFGIAVTTLVECGLALGAVFPNFETDDPEVLSTSLPGLGFVAGSFFYGAAAAGSLYLFLRSGDGGGMIGILAASLLLIFLCLAVAPYILRRQEFIKVY